jgi:hypothetical protein
VSKQPQAWNRGAAQPVYRLSIPPIEGEGLWTFCSFFLSSRAPRHRLVSIEAKQTLEPKTMKKRMLVVEAMIGFLLSALLLCSCATTQSGYPSLRQLQVNVSWPMTRYNNAVAAGAVTLGAQEQVKAAYAQYQAAFAVALKAANNNYDAPSPDNLKALANQLSQILGAIPY